MFMHHNYVDLFRRPQYLFEHFVVFVLVPDVALCPVPLNCAILGTVRHSHECMSFECIFSVCMSNEGMYASRIHACRCGCREYKRDCAQAHDGERLGGVCGIVCYWQAVRYCAIHPVLLCDTSGSFQGCMLLLRVVYRLHSGAQWRLFLFR